VGPRSRYILRGHHVAIRQRPPNKALDEPNCELLCLPVVEPELEMLAASGKRGLGLSRVRGPEGARTMGGWNR
jgi:hypothetical protein